MPRMRLALPTVLLVAAALATQVSAQAPAAGTRVRVTAPALGLDRRVGTLVEIRGDTLLATFDSAPLALPLDAVERVETSVGRRHHRVRRGIVGGLIGGAASLVAVAATADANDSEVVVLYAIFGIPSAVVLGAAIGAATGPARDEWRPLPLSGAAAVSSARVRLTAPSLSLDREVVSVEQVRGGTWTVRRGNGRRVEVPAAAITRVEVRSTMSREDSGWRGARRGFVAGALIGAAGGTRVFRGDPAYNRPTLVAQGAMIGAGVLTVAGAVAGFVHPAGRWAPAPSPRLTVAPEPGGGARLGISLRL
jgi:ribosome maturation factor RimP